MQEDLDKGKLAGAGRGAGKDASSQGRCGRGGRGDETGQK